ncbi:hypothetical protein I3760_01G052400 [Carya illinoinensis]|nr:hypothetical protein I3760_01G052400 [Carya illinoinensis]
MAEATKRYAVVTGSNKGIGFETVRQLASNGIVVVLTARDEKRGLEALQKLQYSGLTDQVVFHQLDVSDPASITSFADFIKTQFGKLDILVNNAGVPGAIVDGDALAASGHGKEGAIVDMSKMFVQTYELAEECIKTNYYGGKRMIEAFVPLLQLSNSPRIVNISSSNGTLKVNNAGIGGVKLDADVGAGAGYDRSKLIQNSELAEECLQTNYYGARRMAETLISVLQLSSSPRIVNISSSLGKLESIQNKWAEGILRDAENLTEEKVDEVLKVFLKDFKEGSLTAKGWPTFLSAYSVSKAAMNAYTRILAKKYPSFCINCVCPGSVKTDINGNTGILSTEEGASSPVMLALMRNGSPSGLFFVQKELSSF